MFEDKIKAMNRMNRHLDRHMSAFKRRSGLECVNGCGLCCRNGELSATIIEFLPAAYHLYLKGQANDMLEQIDNKQDTICVFYNPALQSDYCTQYKQRGLICRLFGFSVRTDKHGTRSLVTCHPIKSAMDSPPTSEVLETAPSLSSYYMRLYGIDPSLAIRYLPVNQAIKEAIEEVMIHFKYRKRPA
jgi:Fe-S-cluster containining protein